MKQKLILCILISTVKLSFSQNIFGYYSGINKQEIGYEYPVEILIEQSNNILLGSINYSSLNCYGKLKFLGKTYDNRYFFKEELTKTSTCVTGGSVVLEALNDNVVIFYWYYPNGKLGSATVLYKSNFNLSIKNNCNKPIQLYGDGSDIYEILTKLNGVLSIAFILDSGASEVSITPDVALTLIRTGTIKPEDWLEGKTYKFADGSTSKSDRFLLKSIQIGDNLIRNVSVSISNSIEAPLLLGQNVLSRLGKISIDYKNNILCVE